MAKENTKKALFKVTADNTSMARYITAPADSTDQTVIVKIKAQLRSTQGSSIGNAAHHRINPLWNEHRKRFLEAKNHKVERKSILTHIESPNKRQHMVANLNRAALKDASRDLVVA